MVHHRLKEADPAKLAKVLEILKSHPHYHSKWSDALVHVNENDRDLVLLMLVAR